MTAHAGNPHLNLQFARKALEVPPEFVRPAIRPFLADQDLKAALVAFTVLKATNDSGAKRSMVGHPCDWQGRLEHGEVCEEEFFSALGRVASRLDAATRSPANTAAIASARNDLLAYRDLLIGAKNGSVQEYRRAFNEALDRLVDACGGQ